MSCVTRYCTVLLGWSGRIDMVWATCSFCWLVGGPSKASRSHVRETRSFRPLFNLQKIVPFTDHTFSTSWRPLTLMRSCWFSLVRSSRITILVPARWGRKNFTSTGGGWSLLSETPCLCLRGSGYTATKSSGVTDNLRFDLNTFITSAR